MVVEVLLGAFHLLTRKLEHVAQLAVDEGVDDGAAQPAREEVVDESPQQCPKGTDEHHQPYLHAAATLGVGGNIDGWRYHHLGGEGNERTLDCHKTSHGPVVHIGIIPVEKVGDKARRR